MAQAFDPATFQNAGDPVRVVEPLSGDAGSSFASISAAADDTVAYVRGAARPFVLVWMDRGGRRLGTVGQPGQYTNVALSPDDTQIAVSLNAGSPANRDVWILNAATGRPSRVTSDPAVDATPLWSPDGRELLFSSQRAGPYQMYRTRTGASEALVRRSTVPTIATDWCRNGRFVFTQGTAATGLEIWATPMPPGIDAVQVTVGPGAKDNGVCSPDNLWLAYQSNASGRDEIYVVPLSGQAGTPARVSNAGGTQPLWRADGQELFYVAPDGAVMAARARVSPGRIDFEPARQLFSGPLSLVIRRSYAVTADGQRFLVPVVDNSNPPVITVTAWRGSELK